MFCHLTLLNCAYYLDLRLEIESGGRLKTKLYEKPNYFTFVINKFPFISSNIPTPPAYGDYISQLMRYSTTKLSCWRKSYAAKATLFQS